ncbi:MAG: hypothetical protein EON58_00670 [Alphaproteobacteria bacterium]|nr:MAG: hypothetical protein EON58_00670 [Alphaproteobacteria bacterium]
MSNQAVTDTGGQSRSLDTTNFDLSELSSNKDTIWSGYFKEVLSNITQYSVKAPSEPPTADASATATEITGIQNSAPEFLERLTNLEKKMIEPTSGVFHTRFFGKESFRGLVASAEGKRFQAVIQDRKGDKYEYEFSHDEILEKQRQELKVGSPIVIHVGHELRGKTKVNVMKIYLANYERQSAVRKELVRKKAASWDF